MLDDDLLLDAFALDDDEPAPEQGDFWSDEEEDLDDDAWRFDS